MLSAELPKKIGQYLIQDELNSTGRTRLFYALDEETGSEYALKLLPSDFFSDPEFQNRFEVEMLALADLDVEEIVPVYHLGDEAGQPYLVLPYLSGGSLAERIMAGPLELDEIVKILLRISIALDAAHQAGIIHRNLKPGNVLFDNHNQAYLSDFCQVKRSLDTGINISNVIDGAPTTMSPEQACGRLDIDYRSDIYSLGALVYEMLAGQPPFPGSNPVSQALQHVRNTPQDIRQLRPDLPEGCAAALEWAMHKDPDQRYRTAGEFALVFEQQAYLPQLYERQRRAPVRRLVRKIALALLTLLLALFGALFVLSWFSYLPEPYRVQSYLYPTTSVPPILPTPTATLTPTLSPTPTRLTPTPTSAPTRTPLPPTLTPIPLPTSTPRTQPPVSKLILGFADQIAVIARGNIWVADLDGSNLKQLTFDGSLKTDLQWTPDGQALIYKTFERSQECYQILYLNGHPQELGCYQDLEISPDMQQIAIGEKVTVAENRNKLWLNFIAPFDLQLLGRMSDVPQAPIYGGCPFTGGTQLKFSPFDDTIAAIFSPDMGRNEYSVSVYRRRDCGQELDFLADLTPSRFKLRGPLGTSQRATIEDFGWDGGDLFALHGNYLHGYGELVIYNRRTGLTRTVSPVKGQCCYQDIQWSPDGSYLLFVFQDASIGVGSQVYYIPYDLLNNMIQSNDLRNVKGSLLQPIAFPADFFADNKTERVEPALRQAVP